jgi:hypothetical protein
MAVPREKCGWAERVEVAVETSVGSGAFAVDDRLRADWAEVLSDGEVGTAQVSVRTDGAFTSADAAVRYYADRRVIVRTAGAVLFDGYPTIGRLTWERGASSRRQATRGPARGREFAVVLEHVVARLGRDVRAQIIGRYVRDGEIVDGLATDPDTWAGALVLASGLPCVFNMDSAGNCDPVPLQASDGFGGVREVYIFTDDSQTGAIPWTVAKVLRYLLHFYAWRDCPVSPRRANEQMESAVSSTGGGREAFVESDPLTYALLGEPDTLVLEATGLLEAIAMLSATAGLHMTAESSQSGAGVRTEWRIWSDSSGPARELRLAPVQFGLMEQVYPTPTVAELFEENNVSTSSMIWDARPIAETAWVVGDVRRYEAQVELVPGWLPETDLDNVPAEQRAAAKAKALTDEQIAALGESAAQDPWYRAVHRGGAEFSEHWQVGRLWVLNEAGTYDPSQYNRNAPFDAYAPYGFAEMFAGRWMRRRRRFLPVAQDPGEVERVRLEVSLDGGQNWLLLDFGYEVLSKECGIWLSVANPLSIAPAGEAAETNLWYALIDQGCRVRVTALIESDDRLMAKASGRSAPALFRNAAVLYAPQRFRFLRRLTGSGEEAWPQEAGATVDRDDSVLMGEMAESMAAARGTRGVTARPVIPWLDTSYAIGDRIVGIRGRGLQFAADRAPSRRHACVIGKRFRFGGDHFETELILASANSAGADRVTGS